MRFQRVRIESMAYAIPPIPYSSEAIEQRLLPLYERLKLPQGRLELMTGIKERRFWEEPMRPSEASALAGKSLLQRSLIVKDGVDMLIHAAVCRDRLEPATAAYVHQRLGMSHKTQLFDVSNACLGFLNAMVLAGGLIESGQIRSAMIVSGENGRPLLDRTLDLLLEKDWNRREIKPYFANLTIGAGAVAAMLCHESLVSEDVPHLLGGISESDTSHNELCQGDASRSGDGLEMQTDSEELLDAGIAVAGRAWSRFKAEMNWDERTPDRIITHQVGRAHQRRLFEALRLDPAKDFTTYSFLGNVGSVSLPITLALAQEKEAVRKGDHVALLGIGSGLSSLMLGIKT